MYTLIRDPDGTVTLRTHVDPGDLPATEARRLLVALHPVLEILRQRSGADPAFVAPRAAGASRRAGPAPLAPLPTEPELVPVG